MPQSESNAGIPQNNSTISRGNSAKSNGSRRAFGSHLTKINTPRNSVDGRVISTTVKSETSIQTQNSTLQPILENTPGLSPIPSFTDTELTSSSSEELPKMSGILADGNIILPSITENSNHLGADNDVSITRVLSGVRPRKSIIDSLDIARTSVSKITSEASLFKNIVKAKQVEMDRIRNTAGVSNKAEKRWKQSVQLVSLKSKRLVDADVLNTLEEKQSDDFFDTIRASQPELVHDMSVVAALELQNKKQKHHNSGGLNTIAKMFNRHKDIVTETPTIFALLRATHIVGVSVVTHQARESEDKELTAYEQTLRHYLAFLPDLAIVNTLRPRTKSLEQLEGVAMFADVSGFTVLCARYGTVNIGKLKDTLNLVMGNIVDEILSSGGDIISFAGDAIFAVWRTHSIAERSSILPKIVKCSIHIQEAVNVVVDKSITLRVKVGLAVGKMFSFYLDSNCRTHIAVVGPAVKSVNKAEGCCVAGNIVCSQEFFSELPEHEKFPCLPSQDGFVQLWPPKNNAKSTVHELLECLGNGNHITLDRCKVVKKISDDLVKQDLLKRYIPDYLRFQLEEGQGTSWASQVRTITTLFISLVFVDTEKISADHCNVQDALTCIDEIVDKMNGTVNKIFTFDKGCTILVAFGTQGFKMNDDPRRALKTAQMILPSLQHKVSDFKGVSIGVTTGLCFCGVVGHEDRHEYTVIGHQVNLACRIMSNYPFCVACDEATKRLSTLPDSAFTTLPPKVLKGVPPGGLYFKYSESGEDITEGTFQSRPVDSDSSITKAVRLVGKAREVDALYSCMTTVESAEPSKGYNIIIVESQAGFGKTKLLDHYHAIGNLRKYNVIMAPLVIDEMTTPFYAVKMIMYKLLELYKPANSRNKEGVIARYVPEYMRSEMCLLNDLLGTRFRRDSTRDFSFKNLHKLLKLIMKEIVGSLPYLFIIDNSEYMDQQSWEFMADLAMLKMKTILVLSMRTTSKRMSRAEAGIIMHHRARRFVLEAFTEDEIVEFSKAYLDVRDIPLDLEKVLTDKTRGIPLYCEGLLKKMVKEQVIKVIDDFDALKHAGDEPRRRNTSRAYSTFSSITRSSRFSSTMFSGSKVRPSLIMQAEGLGMAHAGSLSTFSEQLHGAVVDEDEDLCCTGCFPGKPKENNMVTSMERLETNPETTQNKICVLNDSISLANVALPDSVKELFLAQFDRLSVTEQVTMKCCAVLGTHFSLSLLKSVLPHRTSAQINNSVRIMIKEKVLECGGSFGLNNACTNSSCAKLKARTWELDVIPVCEVMKFCTQFSAEVLRELLLPEQRIRIHETAARVLERRILAYEFCCKKEFFGNVYKICAMGETITPMWSRDRRPSRDTTITPTCQCHAMFTTIYPQIIRHFKEAGTNHSLFEALCSAGALGMALSFTFEAISYLEEALLITKTRTKLNDRHKACLSSLLCLAMYLCPTPTTTKLYREAIHLAGHSQVIYNISCLSYLCGKLPGRDQLEL